MQLTPGTSMKMRYRTGNPNSAKGLAWRKITIITAPFNRDTNSYGMNVDNGARAPHTEIEDRFCQNILPVVMCLIKKLIEILSTL